MHKLRAHLRLRDMSVFANPVTASRNLAIVPEVQEALVVWSAMARDSNWVLIGGLALSMYRTPRTTQDVDILLLKEADVPAYVEGFKKTRPHTFQENGTHVEVELVTPSFVGIPDQLVKKVFDTARDVDGIKVASLEGMIALKLYGSDTPRRHRSDTADIVAMLAHHGKGVDLSSWDLSDKHLSLYETCLSEALS